MEVVVVELVPPVWDKAVLMLEERTFPTSFIIFFAIFLVLNLLKIPLVFLLFVFRRDGDFDADDDDAFTARLVVVVVVTLSVGVFAVGLMVAAAAAFNGR